MCTIAPTMLIDLISSVHGRHPGVEIEIRDSNAHDLDKQLLDGDLDVAIYCIPGKGPDQRVHAMPLFREQMMIVLPPDHALAGKNAILLKDLHGEKYLNRTSCEFNGYADQFFDEQGVECETIYYSDRDDWIQAMIRAGLGFGFMPEHAVTSPHVVARPIVEPAFWREVNLITVRDRPHSPSVGALVREAMRVKWNGVPAISVTNAAARPSEP
jgi:DNA-binding transcriptional LysR family regulator